MHAARRKCSSSSHTWPEVGDLAQQPRLTRRARRCRVDPQRIRFVHPQMSAALCQALAIPALEDATRETLNTSTPLVQTSEIQVTDLLWLAALKPPCWLPSLGCKEG